MKRAVLVASGLLVLSGTLALSGCTTVQTVHGWFLKGTVLSYDQYLTIDQNATPTPTADSVLAALGPPMAVHDRNGIRRSVDYHAYSLTGEMKRAEFTFDENEKLVKKELW